MTGIPARQVNAFLANPPENYRAILVYGSDLGLVSERAQYLAKKFLGPGADDFAITRLNSGDLEADPGRISDEATSIGLFGGRRAIRVRPEREQIADQLDDLFSRIGEDILLVIEAGRLAPAAKLRKLFEAGKLCAALPCYSDSADDLGQIIADHLKKSGLAIDADASAALQAQLGGDRLATRSELDKLALYCLGQDRIALKDVDAVSSESALLNVDDLCDLMGLGRLDDTDLLLQRLLQSGASPDQILAGLNRHLLMLHEFRHAADAGSRIDDLVARHRPPIFFPRKASVIRQCRMWGSKDLNRALEIVGDTERQLRRGDGLGRETISGTVLQICARAASMGQRR
jgi:DNA polymerase III subunit delta